MQILMAQADSSSEVVEKNESVNSFPDLVEKYQHMVFRTCFVFLKNREDAEDIAQEVFVEIYRSYENFRGDSSLSTWIYRIAINRCMDYLRMKNRKKRNLFAFKSFGNEDMEKIKAFSSSNPHKQLESKERDEIIQMAINALPDRQKLAFTLAKIDGLKQDKVAEIMDTTVASIEALLIRAKAKLKQTLLKYPDQIF